jgi:ApeA N-terminal domain 1
MRPSQWWQPDAPEKVLSDVLFEDPDEGWLLELDGNFADADLNAMPAQGITIAGPIRRLDRFPVIVGLSQGKMVSLMNCEPLSFGLFFTRASGSLKVRPTTIIHGVHFESVQDKMKKCRRVERHLVSEVV